MKPDLVEAKIVEALQTFVGTQQVPGRGAFLLSVDANERSLSHHFAICLEHLFPGWDVDCEYNRDGISDDPKKLSLPPRKNPKSNDTDARTVFPDIIVHHRGKLGGDHNLLVIEIKKSSNLADRECSYDKAKLKAFCYQLSYMHAYHITLKTDDSDTMRAPWNLTRC